METPTKTPDSIELFDLIGEFDRAARAARTLAAVSEQKAEGYSKQGDRERLIDALVRQKFSVGQAAGFEEAARRLASLFGIKRPDA